MSCVRGKVVSGRADFGLWIERLSSFYEQKTGMRLYPGTLNVELPSPYSLPRDVIRLEASEYGGRVSVSIVPCRIFNRRRFYYARIRTNKARDITRGMSLKSLPTFGCVTLTN
jgi:riboflavin kinase